MIVGLRDILHALILQISMSVRKAYTHVVRMQLVMMCWKVITAAVMQDSMEMESHALVCGLRLISDFQTDLIIALRDIDTHASQLSHIIMTAFGLCDL